MYLSKQNRRAVPDEHQHQLGTRLIHGKQITDKWDYAHHVNPPVSLTTTYRLESSSRGTQGFDDYGLASPKEHIYVYERLDEPCRGMLEDNISILENALYTMTFNSGMSAISTLLLSLLKLKLPFIFHDKMYGCTESFSNFIKSIAPEYVHYMNLSGLEYCQDKIENDTIFYFETPTNPTLECIDIQNIRKLFPNSIIIVDNTFATPYCQRPLDLGADFSINSLTKNIGGFGVHMGGSVSFNDVKYYKDLAVIRKDTGSHLGAMPAWFILNVGLPTLIIRMEKQIATANKVVDFLQNIPYIKVCYPGNEVARRQMISRDGEPKFGNMIYFEFIQDKNLEKCKSFVSQVSKLAYCLTLAVSLGHIKTLVECPALMTHRQSGGVASMPGVRISIGLEESEDIIQDLQTSFSNM